MNTLDYFDVVNVFAFAEEMERNQGLNESQTLTLIRFYRLCSANEQEELNTLFPDVVKHIL